MTSLTRDRPRAERRVGGPTATYGETVISAASVRQAIQAHPRLVDVAVAAAVAGFAAMPVVLGIQPDGKDPGASDLVAAGLAFVLLLPRRRAPLAVLALSLLAAVTSIVTGATTLHVLEGVTMIALYTVTSTIRRWPAVVAAAVTAAALYAANAYEVGSVISGDSFGEVAFTGMAAAIGVTVRTWRDYVTAVEERAERAEATREEEARRRVAEERLRIARELHDVIAHHIALITVQAGVASHLMRNQPEQSEVALSHIREAGRAVLDELGSLLYVLRQSGEEAMPTEPLPGMSRLGQLLESFTAAGLGVQQRVLGEPRPLPVATDLAAYRIIQEGLTNAHKHGNASGARLLLAYRADALDITIHNAVRAGLPAAGTGHGITGMRERALAAGGTLDAGPAPGGTFRLHSRLPLPPEVRPATASAEGRLA
ncbi:histidine kinase [Actinomycetes bacterium KLBMP 9797]